MGKAGMRTARLKAPSGFLTAHYHCVSRVVERRFAFGQEEKDQFVELMRRYERFCGSTICLSLSLIYEKAQQLKQQ